MEDIKIDSEFCYRAKKVIQKFNITKSLFKLRCFCSQEKSKRWLVENLNDFLSDTNKNKFIDIAIIGSWYGFLPYIFKQDLKCKLISEIRCYDVDDTAKKIARLILGDPDRVNFMTRNIDDVDFSQQRFNIIINTSCEHMNDNQLHNWLLKTRPKTTCVMQSTNKFARDHCNTVENENELVDNFKEHFSKYKSFSYNFGEYSRFMIIGVKK